MYCIRPLLVSLNGINWKQITVILGLLMFAFNCVHAGGGALRRMPKALSFRFPKQPTLRWKQRTWQKQGKN